MYFCKTDMTNKEKLLHILELVTDRMFETRPKTSVCLRPFIKNNAITRKFRQTIDIDMNKIHPKAEYGNMCCAVVDLLVMCDTEVNLMVKGNCDVYFDKREILSVKSTVVRSEQELKAVSFKAKEGYNRIVFECECNESGFGVEFKASHMHSPDIWANDILLWIRDTIPIEEYRCEQGIAVSELYVKADGITAADFFDNKCQYAFPEKTLDDKMVDFEALYGGEGRNKAIAVSYCKEDTVLEIEKKGKLSVFINDKEIYSDKVELKSGDQIVVICEKSCEGWGFECENSSLYIPFLHSRRDKGVHWLLLGSVNDFDIKKIQFKKPYKNTDGKDIFWRFADKNVYLRPYLDSCFFGQWAYALMVGEYGILKVSEYKSEYYEYFYESMSTMIDYFDYMLYDKNTFGNTTFMPRSVQLINLDAIGAAGMVFCELYKREKDEKRKEEIMHILRALEDKIYSVIPRMENGTFYRVKTMWADDTFMSCPFLVRLGEITGEKKHYREAARQLLNYRDILFMEKEGVYSHIYYPETMDRNNIPWCRGNGWVFFAMEDALEHLPEDTEGYNEILKNFRLFAEGLKSLQSESGMWRQVLNYPETYLETSGSSIFVIGMIKAVKHGWLHKSYLEIAEKALCDIICRMIDEEGNIMGVCRGSQCSRDVKYYAELGTNCNDDHGTGLVITAICELVNILGK